MASKTVKDQVSSLLKKKWATSEEIDSISPSGTRRLRELRSNGAPIQKRYSTSLGAFQYRIAK